MNYRYYFVGVFRQYDNDKIFRGLLRSVVVFLEGLQVKHTTIEHESLTAQCPQIESWLVGKRNHEP